ncbi:MAG: hydantoinase B/oxoprolinase family protein, partial [Deltaproteobacteria bacterium]|nr:hydantoinase B/oxoprolinase family protein [Deltaproteobacteria bacterium]
YEIFSHRLFHLLEEGRIAIRMVSGSPVVAEGGETMCAFYREDGTPILVAAGVLLHCMGAWGFIQKTLEWYGEDPGIHDGDQLLFNDPYIGGHHLPDQVIIKPIFYRGERIAWTGAIMHTPEIGGMEPGGMHASTTELYQEGIKILGLKIVEGGRFRPDVFRTIVEQTRDPQLVGLDIKARIAANNVCARGYLALVEKFGLEFVRDASERIIQDSERMARAKLRSLPDGTWQARRYGDQDGLHERPFKLICTMIKRGDEVLFDLTGSSPQNPGSVNDTLPATWASLFIVLASQLFWDVPWNGGMFAPVRLVAPEGTVVHCRFPAACSTGVLTVGDMVPQAAHECIAKMFYAGGLREDVTSGWIGGHDHPSFGGVNQHGNECAGIILDTFAGGIGATPDRDGIHTGGHMKNPQSSISDVELLEMNLPLLALGRRQAPDTGGFGKHAGGMGGETAWLVYGTDRFRIGIVGVGRKAPGGKGIFGGYGPALLEHRLVVDSDIREWFARSRAPRTIAEAGQLRGRLIDLPSTVAPVPVREGDLFVYTWCAGSGYGDPLERDPARVLADLRDGVISETVAREIYGVVVSEGGEVDLAATERQRQALRQERLATARRPAGTGRPG